jgi:hypothetical protein
VRSEKFRSAESFKPGFGIQVYLRTVGGSLGIPIGCVGFSFLIGRKPVLFPLAV